MEYFNFIFMVIPLQGGAFLKGYFYSIAKDGSTSSSAVYLDFSPGPSCIFHVGDQSVWTCGQYYKESQRKSKKVETLFSISMIHFEELALRLGHLKFFFCLLLLYPRISPLNIWTEWLTPSVIFRSHNPPAFFCHSLLFFLLADWTPCGKFL